MGASADPHPDWPPPDHALFEREMACYGRQLYPAALRLTGNHADAEDLLQETMTRAYAGLDRFTPGTSARAWLYRIMTNAFVSACRKRQRQPPQVLSPDPGLVQAATGRPARGLRAAAPSAEEEVLRQFALAECRAALDGLPDCYRVTIYLADVEGYSYRDVAAIVGVPIGTVMSRLHRARGRVRAELATQFRPRWPVSELG